MKVAHAFLDPSDPDYPAVERSVVRYDYEPARTAQGLVELGYARSEDGSWVDATGQRLEVEILPRPHDGAPVAPSEIEEQAS